ncbi:MAG: T9SS type A sorting domain-containing protein [Bacteroidota bacterium]
MRSSQLIQFCLLALVTLGFQQSTLAQCAATSGTITTTDGRSVVYTCPGDGNDDVFTFAAEGINEELSFQYVVTDDNFNVIGLPPTNMVNAEGAGVGTCYIWGFNYEGNILMEVGDPLFGTRFADGCYQATRTSVKLIRDMPEGGTVSMPNGNTERAVCTTDGYNDVVRFRHETTSAAAYRYVITDDQNNILGLPPSDNLNFEGVFPGVCRVWGLSYTGNITAAVGDNAAEVALTDDCFDLSDNFITVTRTDVDGGTVSTADGETNITTVPGDGEDDVFMFAHISDSDANFAYVVTDDNNVIIGTPPANMVNFEGAGEGICRVWGVSYTGDLNYLLGGTLGDFALSDDCFDISENFVTVVRSADGADCDVSGGTIALDNGEMAASICVDGIGDPLNVSVSGSQGENRAWIITDDAGNILALPPSPPFDLDGAGPGTCLIWYLRYDGEIEGLATGNNAEDLAGCFNLSNPITVVRELTEAGTVTTADGATEIEITTISDGEADVVEFAHSGDSGENFAYVVTDENGIILGLPPANMVNFEGAGAGVCLVWGLSYTGEVTAMMGDNALEVALSDGCFDLSDEAVSVTRTTGGANTDDEDARLVSNLEVFPNPATTDIQLRFDVNATTATRGQLVIYSVYGNVKEVRNVDLAPGMNDFRIRAQDYTDGNYFVELRTNQAVFKTQFVKN